MYGRRTVIGIFFPDVSNLRVMKDNKKFYYFST